MFCMQTQCIYPQPYLRISPTLVLSEIPCPATSTAALRAGDGVPLSSAPCVLSSQAPMCFSYPLSILLISSPTHLLCWILTLCVQYFLNLLLRAFLCLPQISSFPAAAPYEAITITGTAPLADINIALL